LNSSPTFAAIIGQSVMMSVLEDCIRQKWSAADKAFFWFSWKVFHTDFLLEGHTVSK